MMIIVASFIEIVFVVRLLNHCYDRECLMDFILTKIFCFCILSLIIFLIRYKYEIINFRVNKK